MCRTNLNAPDRAYCRTKYRFGEANRNCYGTISQLSFASTCAPAFAYIRELTIETDVMDPTIFIIMAVGFTAIGAHGWFEIFRELSNIIKQKIQD